MTFSPELDIAIRKTAKQGPYNASVNDRKAMVTFTPENVSAANFVDTMLKLDGAGVRIGGVRAGSGFEEALTVTASQALGVILTVPRAVFTKGSLRFAGNATGGAWELIEAAQLILE